MWTDAIYPLKKFSLPLILFFCMAFIFYRKDFTSSKQRRLFLFSRCFTHMEAQIVYTYVYIYIRKYPWPVSFKKHYVHPRLLLHSNASLCYCMLFNQMTHSLVKEALHRLAPKLSLRNIAINMLKWLLKGFHSEAMLSSFLKFLYFFNRTLHSWNSL